MAALVFIALVSLGIISLLGLSTYQSRVTGRRLERERIFYVAESGIDQVIHWFNAPTDYTADPALFTKDATSESYYSSPSGDPPYGHNVFLDRVSGTQTLIGPGSNEDLIVFTNDPINAGELARVSSLTISALAASPSAGQDEILIVTSTASNARGVERTVRATLRALPPFPLEIDAAIIDHNSLGSGGQFNVHWGEAWAKGDLELPNGGVNNIPTVTMDPWMHVRTVQNLMMPNGNYADGTIGGDVSPIPEGEDNYQEPWLITDPEHENLHQHWDESLLTWPILDYNQWRTAALDRGHYFSTDASGNIYMGTEETPENRLNSSEFFSIINQYDEVVVSDDPDLQVLPQPQIVFVDTVDGQPPAADGSNFCDISLAGGGGVFTRGVLYIGGHLDSNFNSNSSPNIWIQDPAFIEGDFVNGEQIQQNIRHMGVLFTAGHYWQNGSARIYGSVIAVGGFGTGGAPAVYYDARLDIGIPFNFNSEVSVALWEELPIDPIN